MQARNDSACISNHRLKPLFGRNNPNIRLIYGSGIYRPNNRATWDFSSEPCFNGQSLLILSKINLYKISNKNVFSWSFTRLPNKPPRQPSFDSLSCNGVIVNHLAKSPSLCLLHKSRATVWAAEFSDFWIYPLNIDHAVWVNAHSLLDKHRTFRPLNRSLPRKR